MKYRRSGALLTRLAFVVSQRRCLLVQLHSIPLRGIRDRRKKNSSLAPVTGIPLGMELHAGKMAGVQNDLAAFPLVPGKLLGLLPAVCRHLHFHLQRFPDGNIIMVHRSCSFPWLPRMGIPSRWHRKSFTSFPRGGGLSSTR